MTAWLMTALAMTASAMTAQSTHKQQQKRKILFEYLEYITLGYGCLSSSLIVKLGGGPIVGRPHLKIVRSDNDGLDLSIHISWKLRRRASKWL